MVDAAAQLPTWFWAAVCLAVSMLGIWTIFVFRHEWQKKADHMRDTYQLSFPHEMTDDHVLKALHAIWSDTPNFKLLHPSYPILLEKIGKGTERIYYISIPHQLHDNVSALLEATIDGIFLDTVKAEDDLVLNTVWDEFIELGMKNIHKPLLIDDAKAVSVRIDSKYSLLGEGELLLLQWAIMPDVPRRSTPETKEKLSGRTFNTSARAAAAGPNAKRNLENLRSSLRGVSSADARLVRMRYPNVPERIRERRGRPYSIYLNDKELIALMGWQLDGSGRLRSRRLQTHSSIPQKEGIVIASANHTRSRGKLLRIPISKLPTHQWWVGPTESGKSAALHVQAEQFARLGMGFAVIEPKGDLARDILGSIPKDRINDVIYFDPTDMAHPIGLNLLAGEDPYRTTSHIVSMLHKKYPDSWGPRLEMFAKTGIFTAAFNKLSIFEVKEMMRNPEFRRPYVRKLQDTHIKRDWKDVDGAGEAAIYSVTNKIDALAPNPMMQNIVGQVTGINMRDIILQKKILLVPLDSIAIGETNAEILGEFIIDQLWMAARSIPEEQREVFPIIADEFQKFVQTVDDIEEMTAMARSYKLAFIGAHQYTGQLAQRNKTILTAMENNARSKFVFAVSAGKEAEGLAKFFPPMKPFDLEMLSKHEIVASINTEDGIAPAATGFTFAPPRPSGYGPAARRASRDNWSRPRGEVQAEIASRYKSVDQERRRPKIGHVDE